LGPNTDEHDYNFKKVHAQNFLKDGFKVKALVFFKGRNYNIKEKGEINGKDWLKNLRKS